MRPTQIFSRRKVKDPRNRRWTWLFQTDVGELNSAQIGEYLGLPHYSVLNRINRLGLTNPRVLHVGPMPVGRSKGVYPGNGKWQALSDANRKHPDEVVIGEYERQLPDPYNEQRVRQYDREYFAF